MQTSISDICRCRRQAGTQLPESRFHTATNRSDTPGISPDVAANARHGPRISAAGSTVAVWVIPANEDLTIAQHTLEWLEMGQGRTD